jgi:CheY-like chemotaxis protein
MGRIMTVHIDYLLLVVSYNVQTRRSLAENLESIGATGTACETFLQAEDMARESAYNGILVDLQSMVKAKGDEKVIACSLISVYPALRVRVLGSLLVPMAMPGDSQQQSSLINFLRDSCTPFVPRRLRRYRRRDVVLPALLGPSPGERAVVLNLSWGGAFIADVHPERFAIDSNLVLTLPEFGVETVVTIRRIQPWGERRVPGIGVSFGVLDEKLETSLASVLKSSNTDDRDRIVR